MNASPTSDLTIEDRIKWVFTGSNGIRAGWRLLIFLAVVVGAAVALSLAIQFVQHAIMHTPPHHHQSPKASAVVTPLQTINEGLMFVTILFAAFIMSKIERRPMERYGLPWQGFFQKRLWLGFLWGFATISLVLLAMFAFHGFQITGITTNGGALIESGLIWTTMFLLVGLSEEFMFRGYPQYTLTTGMGFWPAALVLSLGFGAVHMSNSGETPLGIASVVAFALVFCLVIQRTGNLWVGVGWHAGWDWGQSFFYGTPDSGMLTWHPFLTSVSHGPLWIGGGTTGPEATIFTWLALALTAGVTLWLFPKPTYEIGPLLPMGSSNSLSPGTNILDDSTNEASY